jgi:hypothetical protein
MTSSAPSWTDTGGFWIALAALAASIVALGFSVWSAISGHRSAKAAETSAKAARSAADSSAVAARAAEKSADADGRVARVELDRDHRELAPKLLNAGFVPNTSGHGGWPQLFYHFTLPRTYRVHGDLVFGGGSRTPLTVDPGSIIQGGLEARAFIGEPNSTAMPERVELRFYPAHPGDPGGAWTCQCGEPVLPDGHESGGHWVVPVKVPPPA